MKKIHFLSLTLIFVIAISLLLFTKAICEDEDFALGMLCNSNVSFWYEEFLASISSNPGVFYEYQEVSIAPRSIMAYLERHEKSPPALPKFS
ncbi:MAG TPA: hypothetical protein VMD04_01370 [Candidatus Margulisiibacteriota bacterium]|nr:hypothetical protein [Candidatus Margulisiibacteriota bacterium]